MWLATTPLLADMVPHAAIFNIESGLLDTNRNPWPDSHPA
jgi:hypothetical protein